MPATTHIWVCISDAGFTCCAPFTNCVASFPHRVCLHGPRSFATFTIEPRLSHMITRGTAHERELSRRKNGPHPQARTTNPRGRKIPYARGCFSSRAGCLHL